MYTQSPSMRLSTSRHASRILNQTTNSNINSNNISYFSFADQTMATAHTLYYDAEGPATVTDQIDVPVQNTLDNMYQQFVEAQEKYYSDDQAFDLIKEFEDLNSDYLHVLTDLRSKRVQTDKDSNLCAKLEAMLKEERNSWRLARALFSDHINTRSREENEEEQMDEDRMLPMSDAQLIEHFYLHNSTVRRLQLVTDWLEANESDDMNYKAEYDRAEFYGSSHGAWENTFHAMRNKNLIAPNFSDSTSQETCPAMDPDAPIRTKKPLADLDKEDEFRLFKQLFKYIRAGKLDESQETARKVGYHWFAASLDGWLPYSDPNFENVEPSLNDDNMHNGDMVKPITGNKKRDIWRLTCYKTAQMHGLAAYEKAILGLYGGNLKSVLPVCSRWSDQLWARFRCNIDVMIEKTLRNSVVPTQDGVPRFTVDYPPEFYDNYQDLPTVFRHIETQKLNAPLREIMIHNVVQKFFILNDVTGLLEQMSKWCKTIDFEDGQQEGLTPQFLRFFAHVVLLLRKINFVKSDNQHATEILESYIELLTQTKQIECVAFYTATLPRRNQILSFAKLLKTINERDERKYCLKVAKEAHLNVDEITQTVVQLIRTEDTEADLSMIDRERDLPSKINNRDKRKIEALDFLLYTDNLNYVAILHQGCALMRTFAINRKLDAVKETFKRLPINLYELVLEQWRTHTDREEPLELENDRREYLCFKAQLEVQDAIIAWNQYHQHKPEEPKKPSSMSFSDSTKRFADSVNYEQKMKQYQVNISQWVELDKANAINVGSKIMDLFYFPGGWFKDRLTKSTSTESENSMEANDAARAYLGQGDNLSTHNGTPSSEIVVGRSESQVQRNCQLAEMRKIYIPQLTSIVYNVLHLSQQYKECLKIANVLAAEELELYKEFSVLQIREFLENMRQVSLAILKTCPDSLGYSD